MDSIPTMLLGLSLLIATTNAAATGGTEFFSELFEGSGYILSAKTPLTDISDFQEHCADRDGYLAEIDTQAEYDFIMEFVSQNAPGGRQTALVGATDQTTEGQWVYMLSGAPVTFFSWYSNYGTRGTGRDCMYLVWNSRDAGMHDWKCQDTKLRRYVCEVPQVQTPIHSFAAGQPDYYHYYAEAVNYDTARSRCEAKGFTLATPKSESENTDMLHAIESDPDYDSGKHIWISLDDRQQSKSFIWGDGAALSWSNWESGQPNNYWSSTYRETQHCAELEPSFDLQWNDEMCSFDNYYVCQGFEGQWGAWGAWSPCSVTCGSGISVRERACSGGMCQGNSTEQQSCTKRTCDYYHYYAEAVNYDTARSRCESKGFTLATPKSLSENTKMLDAIESHPDYDSGKHVWINLDDRQQSRTFIWGDGAALSWNNWESGQPNNYWSSTYRASQDCAELEPSFDLQWNDEICSFDNYYVCQG